MEEVAAPLRSNARVVSSADSWTTFDSSDQPETYACARAWVALHSVHALVIEALTEALASECGLTMNEFEVLVHLQSVEPRRIRLGDLGGVVSLSQPAISRLVTRLEHQGLVRRIDADDDRRSVLVELTDAGRVTLRRAAPIHANCVRNLLTGQMSDDEQRALVAIFDRIQSDPHQS